MKKRGLQKRPAPGTKVRLTGYFLKCTGQMTGSAGQDRWLIVACDCGCETHKGDFQIVAVNEKLDTSVGYEDQTPEWRAKAMRHINMANLEIVGAPPRAADQADECPPVKRLLQ